MPSQNGQSGAKAALAVDAIRVSSCRNKGAGMDIDADTDVPEARVAGEAHPNAIHLLRTVQAHHVTLSAMADQKANILIGVNSVILALLVRQDSAMTAPMLALAGAASLAAILCMLAVVPAIGTRRSSLSHPSNLLFFGAFTRLSEAEFQAELDTISASDVGIRRAMARDIYQLGLVLRHKKYRYLGWAYRVFMGGLVLTFAVFLGQHVIP